MATIEIPPIPTEAPPLSRSGDLPVVLIQLQDQLERARRRESMWISLVFHIAVVLLAVTSPNWANFPKPISIRVADDLMKDKELTYLEAPPDTQKVDKPPDTNHLSDKNRIATKRPTLDRKDLENLRSGLPGPPLPAGPPQPAAAPGPAPPPQPASPPSTAGSQTSPNSALQPQPQTQARLEPAPKLSPPAANPFRNLPSAREQLEQATHAAAASRTGGSFGGGGNYGLGPGGGQGTVNSGLEILTDTMGVDFGPYLERLLHDVRINWYALIPEEARAPLMKKGKVSITFVVLKDGSVRLRTEGMDACGQGMTLVGPSGDVALDRAAWGGITASNPFPPLPADFRGPCLGLRFHFFYNPDKHDLE